MERDRKMNKERADESEQEKGDTLKKVTRKAILEQEERI